MKFFITSDVHSFFSIMKEALLSKGFEVDNPEHYLIICGDLFDRGNESKQLLDFVKELGDRFIYVKGNHESLLSQCVQEIVSGQSVSGYHVSNGTLKTIAQFCDVDMWELYNTHRSNTLNQLVYDKMNGILDWIDSKAVNYFELGDYIFVHGWVPCTFDDPLLPRMYRKLTVADKEEWTDFLWEDARWINGIDAWRQGCVIPGKTIVCGHWHCSWGWSIVRQQRKEFPDKSKKDWQKSFEPFVDDGIIAIDACTAYSGICNVIEMEVDVEDEDTSS